MVGGGGGRRVRVDVNQELNLLLKFKKIREGGVRAVVNQEFKLFVKNAK